MSLVGLYRLTVVVTLAWVLLSTSPARSAFLPVIGGPTSMGDNSGYVLEEYPVDVGNGVAVGNVSKFEPKWADETMWMGKFAVRWDASGHASELTTLDANFLGGSMSWASGINAAGTSVGAASIYDPTTGYDVLEGCPVAVRWDASGQIHRLALPGPSASSLMPDSSMANGINDAGQIVGSVVKYNASNQCLGSRALRWDDSGHPTELGVLGMHPSGYTECTAYAINASGAAMGWARSYDADGHDLGPRVVRWDPASAAPMEFGHLGTNANGYTECCAYVINADGATAGWAKKFDVLGNNIGWRPVRWDALGNATELEVLGADAKGYSLGYAHQITDQGTAVGRVEKYDASGKKLGPRPTRWDAGSSAVTELDILGTDVNGYANGHANDISEAGVVVGSIDKYDVLGKKLGPVAVLWNPDGTVVDLNSLIDPDAGWTLYTAIAISDTGWIAGEGYYDSPDDSSHWRENRFWLMHVPAAVPEPTSGVLLAVGTLALSARRKKQAAL
ncbi:MAG: PEP-CTERM sorting domain-containing protein [Phycisphaeraceae bacterium]|nr:PEP-CTERM sorting domain-containing protein [Phycisphaeraceae bacterium]